MKTLTGYSDKISVGPGETISFHVSSENNSPYQAELARIVHGDAYPLGPGYKEEKLSASFERIYEGRQQTIDAGSYGRAPSPAALTRLTSFSLHIIAWPTNIEKGEQTLLAHWDGNGGFQLLINEDGAAAFRVGSGSSTYQVSAGKRLEDRRWYSITASYDNATGTLAVNQIPIDREARLEASATIVGRYSPAIDAPITISALLQPQNKPRNYYNGKLEAPHVFAGALSPVELFRLRAPNEAKQHPDLVAGWDFSVGISTARLHSLIGPAMSGYTLNIPARAVTGHNWSGDEMCWRHRPSEYAAIHFHDDDIYDAGWPTAFHWTVPEGLKSGIYCARIFNESDEDFIPFVVRADRKKSSNKLLFLLPTASYMAYGNEHVATDAAPAELLTTKVTVFRAHDVFLATHREYGNSLYDMHSDSSGVSYASRLRPLLNMRPKAETGPGTSGSGVWQLSADTHITAFLEHFDFDYDVITDEDLHYEGVAALKDYRCVITGTHPEYYSKEMLDAISDFKLLGGRLMYMGGNGFYWRVAYHPDAPGVIELRRAEDGIRTWFSQPGEYYHSFTGEYGGLWLRNGRSPQALVGIGTTAQGFDMSTYYRKTKNSRNPRVTFIFEGVNEDIIGDFGVIGNGAAGSEIDRADLSLGTPRHALVVASSEGHSDAYLMVPEDIYATTLNTGGAENPYVHADMTFFETESGGAVFSTGSIAWSGALSHNSYNNNVSQITRNVLMRFLNPESFTAHGPKAASKPEANV